MSQTSVFGIVKSYPQAERVVQGLQDAGFSASEISVLLPDTEGKHDIGHVKATKAPEGATTGATAGGIMRLVLRQTAVLISLGTLAGVLFALATVDSARALLFGLEPADPLVFGAAIGVVVSVAMIAAWIPARRASRVNPATALQ